MGQRSNLIKAKQATLSEGQTNSRKIALSERVPCIERDPEDPTLATARVADQGRTERREGREQDVGPVAGAQRKTTKRAHEGDVGLTNV